MKEILFSEEQLGDLQSLGQTLFSGDSSDPRSRNYRRQLVRPAIPWARIFLFVAFLVAGTFGGYYLLTALSVSPGMALFACLSGAAAVLLLCLKRIIICLVRIYQRFAPASIRNKCRFEPSCSQYMILSLQKYGLWKGLRKGINRLRRCNIHNGGFDFP